MRIAYLINQYPKVSHSFIRREIRALESLGFVVERITLRRTEEPLVDADDREESERTYVVLAQGVKSLVLPFLRSAATRPAATFRAARMAWQLARRTPGSCLRHLAYLFEAAALQARYGTSGVAHVHAHFGTNSAAVALLWNCLGGPPFSMTVHGPEEFDRPENLGLDLKIARARFVVAVSEFGRSQLMRWCDHSQWQKLHVVHCGLDDRFLNSGETPIPDNRRLVCVGRLCEQKGHGLLVDAAERLKREGVEFELVLVGDGPLRPQIETLLKHGGLDDVVRITGWKTGDEVADEIRRARGLVLPSFAEGLPVVIMEALALGRPVISTYVAGIPELVLPDRCGWLVPAGAVSPLSDAMRKLLETPLSRLTEMGRQGVETVRKDHSARTEAGKLAALFGSGEHPIPTRGGHAGTRDCAKSA